MKNIFFRNILAKGNLTVTQYKILMYLCVKRATQGEIADDLNVNKGNVSRAIKELKKMRLIEEEKIHGSVVYGAVNSGVKEREKEEENETDKNMEIVDSFKNMDAEELMELDGSDELCEISEAITTEISKYIGTYQELEKIDRVFAEMTGSESENSLFNDFWQFVDGEFTWGYEILGTTSVNVYFEFADKDFAKNLVERDSKNMEEKNDMISDSFKKMVRIVDVDFL